jgi:curved DNA-binding protein CbpA
MRLKRSIEMPKISCWAGRRHMTEDLTFIDYYEILEISPNANSGTIERMFRHLAQRYHPDNHDTGDRLRFDEIMAAHHTLRNPVKRAQYDIKHKNHSGFVWKLADEASDGNGIERDVDTQNKLLSILYVKRRQNIKDPGIGNHELERLLGCPAEHLEFHVWYMKEKGWIGRTEKGMLAITVEGVDRANSEHHRKTTNKLLTDQNHTD